MKITMVVAVISAVVTAAVAADQPTKFKKTSEYTLRTMTKDELVQRVQTLESGIEGMLAKVKKMSESAKKMKAASDEMRAAHSNYVEKLSATYDKLVIAESKEKAKMQYELFTVMIKHDIDANELPEGLRRNYAAQKAAAGK